MPRSDRLAGADGGRRAKNRPSNVVSAAWMLIALAAIAVRFLLPVQPTHAFRYPGISWGRAPEGQDREVCYYLTPGADKRWGPGIHEAAWKWSAAGAAFRFVYRSNIDDCRQENYFNKTSEQNYPGLFGENPDCADKGCGGITKVYVPKGSNTIVRCKSFLNNIDFPALDAVSVSLHEWGHWLSLEHSNTTRSVMWPVDQGLHDLQADDVNGIIHIYGPRSGSWPTPHVLHNIRFLTALAAADRCREQG